MAQIVTITNPLTGQPAQVDQLDHTAQQIDDAIARALPGGYYDKWVSQLVNPNLLDNWYFGNPVNQRGQTEYATMGYMVDRWKNSSGNTTVLVSDSGLTMVGGTAYLSQKIEDSLLSELDGKIITISSLWTDNVLQTFSWVLNKSQSKLGNDGLDVYTTNNGFFVSRHIGEIQKTVKAAKLELGSQQTLAHKDENGVWVLNEIPDYGEQLRRCRRYLRPLIDSAWGDIGLPTWFNIANTRCYLATDMRSNPMRAAPVAVVMGSGNVRVVGPNKSGAETIVYVNMANTVVSGGNTSEWGEVRFDGGFSVLNTALASTIDLFGANGKILLSAEL